ncbi:MAG TPA: arginine decarboxylase, partial [Oligoflexia bacterium]|nr:arginine decarboxylase [Oligoflexia bacterium]
MAHTLNEIEHWSAEKSRTLYGIDNWGAGYFDVNSRGHIVVRPAGPGGAEVDLYDLVQSVRERGINAPVLFRFNEILRHRIRTLYTAFQSAIKEYNYAGCYLPAYPIKVNQQRPIVDVISQAGSEIAMGLEVGSKPELIAVLGLKTHPQALLLCNGYKDRSYIELALM